MSWGEPITASHHSIATAIALELVVRDVETESVFNRPLPPLAVAMHALGGPNFAGRCLRDKGALKQKSQGTTYDTTAYEQDGVDWLAATHWGDTGGLDLYRYRPDKEWLEHMDAIDCNSPDGIASLRRKPWLVVATRRGAKDIITFDRVTKQEIQSFPSHTVGQTISMVAMEDDNTIVAVNHGDGILIIDLGAQLIRKKVPITGCVGCCLDPRRRFVAISTYCEQGVALLDAHTFEQVQQPQKGSCVPPLGPLPGIENADVTGILWIDDRQVLLGNHQNLGIVSVDPSKGWVVGKTETKLLADDDKFWSIVRLPRSGVVVAAMFDGKHMSLFE